MSPFKGCLTVSMTFLIKTTCQCITLQPIAEWGLHCRRWQLKEKCVCVFCTVNESAWSYQLPDPVITHMTSFTPGNSSFEVCVNTCMKKDIFASDFTRSGPCIQNSRLCVTYICKTHVFLPMMPCKCRSFIPLFRSYLKQKVATRVQLIIALQWTSCGILFFLTWQNFKTFPSCFGSIYIVFWQNWMELFPPKLSITLESVYRSPKTLRLKAAGEIALRQIVLRKLCFQSICWND